MLIGSISWFMLLNYLQIFEVDRNLKLLKETVIQKCRFVKESFIILPFNKCQFAIEMSYDVCFILVLKNLSFSVSLWFNIIRML